MRQTFRALSRAFRDLFQLKILWIVVWPTLVAILLWAVLEWFFGDVFLGWASEALSVTGIQVWLENLKMKWIVSGIQSVLHLLLLVPLVVITALIITAVFAMPALINFIAGRYYPELKYEYGGTIAGGLVNTLLAFIVFIVIWVVTLPLWLTGAGIVIPFVAAAYLNQQLFRYDALSEHASKQEINALLKTNRVSSWSLGLMTGMTQFVPILNFFAGVIAALAFIHLELSRLTDMRSLSDSMTNKK